MRIVFMGTPVFAETILRRLAAEHEVAGAFTNPDRPKGRGNKLAAPPVKTAAAELKIPVFQPATLKDDAAFEAFLSLAPDMVIVAAYGRFLGRRYLEYPRYGCVNVHGSLLPEYRGAAPVQRAVMNGETVTGVSIMEMVPAMDAGGVYSAAEVAIGANDAAGDVFAKLAETGASLLLKTIPEIAAGLKPVPQDESAVTFAPPIETADTLIDWSEPAKKIHDRVRGLNPAPGARSGEYKIIETDLSGGGVPVTCGDGETLYITRIQAPGGKAMPAPDFVRGHGPLRI